MNYQPRPWKKLSRDERAEWVAELYQRLGTLGAVASVLGKGISTIGEHLAYSRVPSDLRKEFNMLSHRAFMRAIRAEGDLEEELKKEKVKHDYYHDTMRWRRMGLQNQLKVVTEQITNATDRRELHRLEKRLDRILEKLNGLDQK